MCGGAFFGAAASSFLEQFQEKCEAVFRPELRKTKG
jgi:hypothetical protein